METQLSDHQSITLDAVHHAMFIGYSTRPESRQRMLQRFGLTHACKWLALRLTYQFVDSLDHAPVLLLPVQVIFPCAIGKNQLHLLNFR